MESFFFSRILRPRACREAFFLLLCCLLMPFAKGQKVVCRDTLPNGVIITECAPVYVARDLRMALAAIDREGGRQFVLELYPTSEYSLFAPRGTRATLSLKSGGEMRLLTMRTTGSGESEVVHVDHENYRQRPIFDVAPNTLETFSGAVGGQERRFQTRLSLPVSPAQLDSLQGGIKSVRILMNNVRRNIRLHGGKSRKYLLRARKNIGPM